MSRTPTLALSQLAVFTLALANAFLAAGCGGQALNSRHPSPETAEAAHAKSHDHDHFAPAHKPAHFSAAVSALPRLARGVGAEMRDGHREHAREALDKLCDVLTWLPEIAADSDMPEREWDEVSVQAGALLALCQQLAQQMSEDRCDAVRREIEQACRRWEAFVLQHRDWFPEAFPVEEKHD